MPSGDFQLRGGPAEIWWGAMRFFWKKRLFFIFTEKKVCYKVCEKNSLVQKITEKKICFIVRKMINVTSKRTQRTPVDFALSGDIL